MKKYTSLALVCTTLLLTSCALTPMAGDPLTDAGLMSSQELQQYDVDRQWWKIYEDPQLNELMETALRNNIDLKQSAITIRKALYYLHISEQDLFPEASASISGSKSVELKSGDESNSWSSTLDLSYELDLWNRLDATSKASLAEWQATTEDLENTRLSLINSVADAWFQLAYIDESIALTKKNIARYEELYNIFKAQYEAGKTTSITLVQSRQSVLSEKQSLTALKDSRATVEQTMNNLLNLRPGERASISPRPLTDLPSTSIDLQVPISVLSARPDVKAAEQRLEKAWYNQTAQKRSWYPQLTLGAGISSSDSQLGKVFDLPIGTGSIALNLPFLQWNTLKWTDKSVEADFEDARLDFEETLTTAFNEVAVYWQQYLLAKETLASREETQKLNRKNSEYYQDRYENGAGELSDWLEAMNTEYSTEQDVVNDRYEVLKEENLVYKAMAGKYTGK
jgi:NodT family efflux transporter outer membrane factor (OMF) lipoprotein